MNAEAHKSAAGGVPLRDTLPDLVTKTVRTIEMKLKHNSFKTVSKLFCFSFISTVRKV